MRRAEILLAAGLLAPLLACADRESSADGTGEAAPAYAAATLAGDTVALADLRGNAVLLNLWATWCAPCREEMPDLQTLADRYEADGLQVVGVSIDQAGARAQVRRFVDRHDIGFAILHDPEGRVSRVFGTVGVPETILIDERGRIHARWTGRIPVAEAEAKVREVLLE